jgi:DNA-binding transcriptional regulator GbsR (MarR family)
MTPPTHAADSSPGGALHQGGSLAFAQDEVAEIFGDIAVFWGFTRTQGRIYGLLFLSPRPLGHRDIQQRLGISAGSTSMTLSSLVHWGVLRRRDRAYEPETDMWKVITGVFRRREKEQVDRAIERIDRVVSTLGAEPPSDAVRFALGRAEQLRDFFRLGRRFLEAFVRGAPLSGLLSTIAQRAARFRPLLTASDHDASIGH